MAGYTVGVDVGGTKILAAVVDASERVLARAKVETPATTSAMVMDAIKDAIREAVRLAGLQLSDVAGIGLGVPGVCGPDGTCIWAPNCPLSNTPVAAILNAEFQLPVTVGNDVNVGTLGEKAFGAARQYQNVFGMFVGTGIGGGLVIDGQVIIGAHCLGAEVGHIIIDYGAAARGEEGGGEFEYYASRLGIERQIRDAIAAGRSTMVAEKLADEEGRIKSGLLKKAIAAEDEVVIEVLTNTARILGLGCVSVIHLVDPQAIVFGGGVMEACGDFLLPLIEDTIANHVAPGNGEKHLLLPSQLGDDAVLLGAVALSRGVTGWASPDAPQDAEYPPIEAPEFGLALVDGQRWDSDLVVRANGQVKKRKKKLSRLATGNAHVVGLAEIEYICRGNPARLVIGCGWSGQLRLAPETEPWLRQHGITVSVLPTADADAEFNRAAGPKALLLHLTC